MDSIQKFADGFEKSLELYIISAEKIRNFFQAKNEDPDQREIIDGLREDVFANLNKIEDSYKRFIIQLNPISIKSELEKQFKEQFGDDEKTDNLLDFVRIKIIYEFVSSFLKISNAAWENIHGSVKVFSTYPSCRYIYDNFTREFFDPIQTLNSDTKQFLKLIEKKFSCSIVGSSAQEPNLLISNIYYQEELDYNYKKIFPDKASSVAKPILNSPVSKTLTSNKVRKIEDEYYHTEIKGTKEWNQNDAYILYIRTTDLLEEQKKFYSSSFVTLNPSENLNINLAAAMVRKNSGQSLAPKYTKMIQTLLEFIINNIFLKDFPYVTDDLNAFLYHIGPVVIYNIIVEDMTRRDFGYCHYVENNKIIKLFPDVVLKKHIIDFWADHFFEIRQESIDSYINYSKGVSNIKESYKNFFDYAASTRKRGFNEKQSIEDYMRENVGKFFGYRRAQVFKRFIPDNVFGSMPEVNSTELLKKIK